jgi:hypothetical protein
MFRFQGKERKYKGNYLFINNNRRGSKKAKYDKTTDYAQIVIFISY